MFEKKEKREQGACQKKETCACSPCSTSVRDIHQVVGNQALKDVYESVGVQAKLEVGEPDTKYEREADAIADRVVRMSDEIAESTSLTHTKHKKQTQTMKIMPYIQRQPGPAKNNAMLGPRRQILESSLGGGFPLPSKTQAFFGSRMGYDFSKVRIHTGTNAVLATNSINARAYTHGNDIVFNSGEYSPNTLSGKHLLAHELVHTVQQSLTNSGRKVMRKIIPQSVKDCGKDGKGNPYFEPTKLIAKAKKNGAPVYDADTIQIVATQKLGKDKLPSHQKFIKAGGEFYVGKQQPVYKYYYPVCWKHSEKKRQVMWVPGGSISIKSKSKKKLKNTGTKIQIFRGGLSQLNGQSDEVITLYIDDLLVPELISAKAEAQASGLKKLIPHIDMEIDHIIANGENFSKFDSFNAAINSSNWVGVAEILSKLSNSQDILLFLTKTTASGRVAVRNYVAEQIIKNRGGYQLVAEAVEEYASIYGYFRNLKQSEKLLRKYRKVFGSDWKSAAKALNHFSPDAILFELSTVKNVSHLRALRKGADAVKADKVSQLISFVISKQKKNEVYITNLTGVSISVVDPVLGNLLVDKGGVRHGWSNQFTAGLQEGGLDVALGSAWKQIQSDFKSLTSANQFIAGLMVGIPHGVLASGTQKVKDTIDMIASVVKLYLRSQYEPKVVAKEIYDIILAFGKGMLAVLDAREFGYTVARLMVADVKHNFGPSKTAGERGFYVGGLIGQVLLEIALALIGGSEVSAALKVMRGTRIVLKLQERFTKSKRITKLLNKAKGGEFAKLVRGVKSTKGADKAADLLKAADAAKDLNKAENILRDLAKLENAVDGPLVGKKMQSLEYEVLKIKVKDPANLKVPNKHYRSKYTVEVEIGNHTYRKKPDGSWCRFSIISCGHQINDALGPGFSIIEKVPLPDIGNGVIQTTRGNMRRRMKRGFGGFKLPQWAHGRNWNAHHVIPWEFLHHDVFNVLRGNGLVWDHNAMKNAIALPTRKGIPGAEKLAIHQARKRIVRGHPVYNNQIKRELDILLDKYELNPKKLHKEVDKLQRRLRRKLKSAKRAGKPLF